MNRLKDKSIIRDTYGRVLGKLDDYWFHTHEDENYKDHKVKDLLFPSHKGNLNGEVHTYNIKDLK